MGERRIPHSTIGLENSGQDSESVVIVIEVFL